MLNKDENEAQVDEHLENQTEEQQTEAVHDEASKQEVVVNDGGNNGGSINGPAKSGMPAWPWMIVSVIAIAAFVFVLVSNGSGNSNNKKLAQFDGGSVTELDFYHEIKKQVTDEQFSTMVDTLVESKLIEELADKAKITVTEEDMNKAIDEAAAYYGGMESFEQVLQQYSTTLETFKEQIKPDLLKKALYKQQNPATEDKIKAYFDDNKDTFATAPEKVRASHILVNTQEEADAIVADLKAGKDFAELAKEKSTDPGSAANGGDLDFFGHGDMVPEFENAAFSMEVGQISDIIPSDYGFHIIKLTDKQAGVYPTYDEVKDKVADAYWTNELTVNSVLWLAKLKEDNHVKNLLNEEAKSSPSASPSSSTSTN